MKILTWNIWDIPTAPARAQRLRLIVRALEAMAADAGGPDVVFLQEVWSARRRPRFRAIYPYVAEAERYGRNPLNWLAGPIEMLGGGFLTIDSGLMTLSRHPVKAIRRHVYRTGERLARKSALAALIETPELGPIWAVNTHLCADQTRRTHGARRTAQLRELGAFLRTLGPEPAVVGGDFNLAPPSPGPLPAQAYDPALWPGAVAEALNLFTTAPGSEGHLTYSATHNPWADPRAGDNRLDYIFAGPGLRASEGAIAMAECHPLGPGLAKPLSDHFAYVTTVRRA